MNKNIIYKGVVIMEKEKCIELINFIKEKYLTNTNISITMDRSIPMYVGSYYNKDNNSFNMNIIILDEEALTKETHSELLKILNIRNEFKFIGDIDNYLNSINIKQDQMLLVKYIYSIMYKLGEIKFMSEEIDDMDKYPDFMRDDYINIYNLKQRPNLDTYVFNLTSQAMYASIFALTNFHNVLKELNISTIGRL
jgi:hypothetical protein